LDFEVAQFALLQAIFPRGRRLSYVLAQLPALSRVGGRCRALALVAGASPMG
jgi:hypothetical protein